MRSARRALVGGALAVTAATVGVVGATAQSLVAGPREAIVVGVQGWSLERMLDEPTLASLGSRGGIALYPDIGHPPAMAAPSDDPSAAVRARLEETDADDVLVVVVGLSPSSSMRERADGLLPILVASGTPGDLLTAVGSSGTLTSTSTHRDGVLSVGDIDAAVSAFLAGAAGPISVVATAPPTDLHRRYLEHRAVATPFGVATALLVALLGAVAVAALRRPAGDRFRRGVAWGAFAVPALAIALLWLGRLPSFAPAIVVIAVSAVTVGLVALVGWIGRDDDDRALIALGVSVLLAFVLEAVGSWDGAQLPLLGGTQLDGARFYGLPNVFIGVLLGGALVVAAVLPARGGAALLVAAGLFAGLPGMGSNVGGATTLLAGAGLWWSLRTASDGRIGLRGLLAAAIATAAGLAAIAIAHVLAPTPTHVTAFVRSGGGVAGFASRYIDRLAIGARMLAEQPFAWVPVIGLLVMLRVLWRPPGAIRDAFAERPVWRDVAWVSSVAGVVAYLANDSGPSAAGFCFGWALVVTLWVSLRRTPARLSV